MSDGTELGPETLKNHAWRISSGFYDRYMKGKGLDIGFRGASDKKARPVLPDAIGVDKDYPGYDGRVLPFENGSMDYVFSSHCLEHILEWMNAIKEWYRVVKVGGHLVIVVPHMYLYEKKRATPSKWNADHKRFYKPFDVLWQIDTALQPNSWRLRECYDNDKGFDYSIGPDKHSNGAYEIVCVIEKIKEPDWILA